jgi:hypothetical protein
MRKETNMKRIPRAALRAAPIIAAIMLAAGCSPAHKGGEVTEKGKGKSVARNDDKKEHDHSGWWCEEHGIPEEICAQCNGKLAADFKKKGDWCADHDRPKSQCFKCDPKLKEKFAAQYRAKYGKEPPHTEDDEKKEDKKG